MDTDSMPRLSRCTMCGNEFPHTTEYFYPVYRNKAQLRTRCKTCCSLAKTQARIEKRLAAGRPLWRSPSSARTIHKDGQEVIEIPLTRGYVTIVDLVDADLADRLWFISDANYPYPASGSHKRRFRMHRVITERIIGRPLRRGEEVDHIDGDSLNNRRSNLRVATHQQNIQNRAAWGNSRSGKLGVHWHKKTRKWVAVLKGKTLGYFTTIEDAHAVYLKAAQEEYGEFAPIGRQPKFPRESSRSVPMQKQGG